MSSAKYLKIRDYLKDIAVRPKSAVRMPTIRELMNQFNVSLATVTRALSILENEGLIVRRQGSGIVATGGAGVVGQVAESGDDSEGELFFAYVDYPAETLWENIHSVTVHAKSRRCGIVNFKMHQDTTTAALMDCIRRYPRCRGVVVMPGSERYDQERLDALGALGMRVSILDGAYFYDGTPANIRTFTPDPADGARKTVELLAAKGHRHIGLVRNEPASDYVERHAKAFSEACRERGLPFGPERGFNAAIRSWENAMDAAVTLTRRHLNDIRGLGLTALVYKSSPGALAAIRVLSREAGMRVPEDIGVVGEGEAAVFAYMHPGLTTVTADYPDICRAAVDFALGDAASEEPHVLFPLRTRERESVMEPSAAALAAAEA